MLTLIALAAMANQDSGPPSVAPLPAPRQLAWHAMETYAFVHFGPNTFTGEEWGHGTEDPKVFNPKRLDCRQWVRALKAGGMKGVIITAKHHDGFCLWPSKLSTHTVARSPWRNGRGDVLRELSEACKAEGLKFGVYLSPWDRNHPSYGTPEYNRVFADMLREVLTGYGPVFEVWFDGANGEGPNGKRQVYDWELFVRTVRELQPNAVIFSDAGPDVRWVGNEAGIASETNWNALQRERFVPGTPHYKELGEGHENGGHWVPAECDVSIRPGWFWRASENAKVKTPSQLLDLYYQSVGRGSTLLLNVPPNSDGLIADEDAKSLREFHTAVGREFARPVRPARAEGESYGPGYEASRAVDGKAATAWAAPNGSASGRVAFRFERASKIDRVLLAEPIERGQRIRKFSVEVRDGTDWRTIAQGTTVGRKRLLRITPVVTEEVRVSIQEARACPMLSEVAFFDAGGNGK